MSKTINLLNHFMVNVFNDIITVERRVFCQGEFKDISITEIHTMEAIGINEPKKMSEIAMDLNITLGTLTTAINRLVKKGYVERIRIKEDRRIVQIQLTDKGKCAYKAHENFHDDMIKAMVQGLEKNEEEVLAKALKNIHEFFKTKYNLRND